MENQSIKMNCIVSDISLKGINLHRFEIIPQTEKRISLPKYGYRVTRAIKDTTCVHTGGKYLYAFNPDDIPSTVHIDGIPFDLRHPEIEALNPESEAHLRAVRGILTGQIRRILATMGYTLEDNGVLYKPEFTSSENIESHPAVEIQIQLSPKGRVMLFLDVKRRWVCPFLRFLGSLGPLTLAEKEEILKGKEVMVHTSSKHLQSMKLKEIIDAEHGTHHLNSEGNPTLYEYWSNPPRDKRARIEGIKRKLDYKPNPKDRGVAVLSTDESEWTYPFEVLRMKIDLSDFELLEMLDLDAEKAYMSPEDREKEIGSIFEHLSAEDCHFHDKVLSFRTESGVLRWGTLAELEEDGFELVHLDPPELEFGSGFKTTFQPGTSNVNRALRQGGPYSGRRDIVLDTLYPQNAPSRKIDDFFSSIMKLFEDYNLGTLERGEVILVPDSPPAYGAKAADFYYDMRDKGNDISNRFMIGVLPYENQDHCHHALNNELLRLGIPSKCIQLANFMRIQPYRSPPHLYPLVGAIYERSLGVGEATWILAEKAGKSTAPLTDFLSTLQKDKEDEEYDTVYIGFDVSRVPGKAEVASYATVCEPHGRVMSVRHRQFKGEYLSSNEVREIINDVFREYEEARRRLGRGAVDEIVFFKDGDTRGYLAGNAIEEGLDEVKDDLVSSDRAKKDLRISYVTVKKSIIHRIFGDGKLPEGVCLVNREYKNPQAIVITTTPFAQRTTQSPNMISQMFRLGKEDSTGIYRIAKEYHDLRFLHWETWRVQPGTAIPLHIVQHKAKQLGYGYDTVYIPK